MLGVGFGEGDIKREVCAAVRLGWQMAELFHEPPAALVISGVGSRKSTLDLPGVGKLTSEEKRALRMAQLAHGLQLLASATGDEQVQAIHQEVREDIERERIPDDLRALHVEMLSALTVADVRLGKGYGLGRALFEVCREGQDGDDFEAHLADNHLNKLVAWCADLKTVLPDHAGEAVAGSLRRWQNWARQKPWMLVTGADFGARLNRQGERWRAILTGEKDPRDLLTVTTYIQAGEELLSDAAKVGASFAKRFWALILIAAALLVLGILAAIFVNGTQAVIGGIAAIAASLGITWKTATPTLKELANNLSGPLWQAELDAAITVAATDPMVPASAAVLPSTDQPLPVRYATDERTARKAARQVWKQLDRGTRTRLLPGRLSPARRLSYRFAGLWRGGTRAAFMPHDIYLNYVQSAVETRLASTNLEAMETSRDELFAQFGPDDWRWCKTVVQAALTRLDGKHPFGVEPDEHEMGDTARIVLFGDWATGTPLAQALAKRVTDAIGDDTLAVTYPDGREVERHVIHLGDVYYCGEPDEYRRRFLTFWPVSSEDPNVHSWNLNGNHDMYSGGHGYFGLLSSDPELDLPSNAFRHQNGTSFFRIFNDHWQIIGLDSAYTDNDLDPRQLERVNQWLGLQPGDKHALPGGRRRRTILLSHHQLGSSRAQASVGPGIREKTEEARKKKLIHAWFWGHEHRAFIYDDYLDVKCPVCVGNGGVPELLSHIFTLAGAFQGAIDFVKKLTSWLRPQRWKVGAPKVVFKPEGIRRDRQGLKWEPLGFVVVDLAADSGRAVYYGEEDEQYEIESFTI